ncbi:MAG TPA: OmpA family protein [Prolixibacteraceae bacterium]|jgi:outer membrane protein OmpA-like peptidoglycan-associated protein
MKIVKFILPAVLASALLFSGCSSLTKTQKGAGIGAVAGGAAGAIIGRAAGNTAMGTVIGAAVGGVSGAVIGRKMDKQAAEIKNEVPGVKVERVGEGIVVEFTSNILFGFDNAALTSEAKENLGKLVTILNKYPDTNIAIYGHTDSKGSESYNQRLSEKRAKAVSNYLVSQDIASNRLTTKGFGETQPKYSNDTASGQSQNRRVEFAITANEKMKQEAQ